MTLSKRLDKLEEAIMKHLEESGEIRADIKWLKKAFWAMVGIVGVGFGAIITAGVEHLWR